MNKEKTLDEIVLQSGNNFHCKVLKKFRALGWSTMVSPYYMDSSLNKPREIDLVAEKAFEHRNRWGECIGTINVKLYIECKFIPTRTVFWFDSKNRLATTDWLVQHAGLKENNLYTEKHHYLSTNPEVAKLFSGETGRDQENEVIYKALNQALNAMISNRWGPSIIPEDKHQPTDVVLTVEYPVIICNSLDNFYRVDVTEDSTPTKIENNFQLEVNYAFKDDSGRKRNEYFLIDVVGFNLIDEYIGLVQSDISPISSLIGH